MRTKAQQNERKRLWRNSHPERVLEIRRKYMYGIDRETVIAKLSAQGGLCKICGGDNGGKPLHVDHNHKTGENRSMLCGNCNRGLGLFKEDKRVLQVAIDYLTLWDDRAIQVESNTGIPVHSCKDRKRHVQLTPRAE